MHLCRDIVSDILKNEDDCSYYISEDKAHGEYAVRPDIFAVKFHFLIFEKNSHFPKTTDVAAFDFEENMF